VSSSCFLAFQVRGGGKKSPTITEYLLMWREGLCIIAVFNLIVLLVSTRKAKREKCINGKTSVLASPSAQPQKLGERVREQGERVAIGVPEAPPQCPPAGSLGTSPADGGASISVCKSLWILLE